MKNNPRYLSMINGVSFVNEKPTQLPDEIVRIQKTSCVKKMPSSINSIYSYLSGETDIHDFANEYREELSMVFSNSNQEIEDLPRYVYDEFRYSKQTPSISKLRVSEGFKAGLIDFVSNALIRTKDGSWKDAIHNHSLPAETSLVDILNYVKSQKVNVIPSVTTDDLEVAEERGVLIIGSDTIARKEDGRWIESEHKKSFDEGDLIRLLHHQNKPVAIYANLPESRYYHANVSDKNTPSDRHLVRKGSSIQGDAFYATSSVDEAVRIYGNPKSFELRGKLLGMREREGVDDSKYMFGHLYELKSSNCSFKASLKSRHLSANEIPSVAAFMLVASENNIPKGYAENAWMQIKSAQSTYEVYRVLNELNAYSPQFSGSTNCMSQLIRGLGFDSIEVVFPSEEQILGFRERAKEIESLSDEEASALKINKQNVFSRIAQVIDLIENSIPARAQKSHLIAFNENKVRTEHLGLLPLNKELVGKTDNFYTREKPIELSDLFSRAKNADMELGS